MKNKAENILDESRGSEELSDRELAEAFIFPSSINPSVKEEKEDEDFWSERRNQFEDRTLQQKIYDKLLQLKFQLEDYVENKTYEADFSFGYFLNEDILRPIKSLLRKIWFSHGKMLLHVSNET